MIRMASYVGLLIAGTMSASIALAESQPMSDSHYLCTGIGEAELSQVRVLKELYSVELLFADTEGAYLADVAVKVEDMFGVQLASVANCGPFFFIKLPEGEYQISVMRAGVAQAARVKIEEGRHVSQTFRWR